MNVAEWKLKMEAKISKHELKHEYTGGLVAQECRRFIREIEKESEGSYECKKCGASGAMPYWMKRGDEITWFCSLECMDNFRHAKGES